MGGIHNFILTKIQFAVRLKNFEVLIANEFIIHQVLTLNQLPSSFYTTQKEKWNIYELIFICVKEELRHNMHKVETSNMTIHSKPWLKWYAE